MGVGNRPGMVKTDNLGMNRGTSRGFMDNLSAGENTEILDAVAGAMQETRFLVGYDLTVPVIDTWTFVDLPPAVATMIAEPLFGNGEVRFSNAVKILCCRLRALMNTPGAGGVVEFQLRKGDNTATAADDLLINPIVMDDSVADIQNSSGIGKGQPVTPIVGLDKGGVSLWVKRDAVVTETDMDLEVIIAAQMVPGIPTNFIET